MTLVVALLAHRDNFGSAIAQNSLCRVGRRADRAFEFNADPFHPQRIGIAFVVAICRHCCRRHGSDRSEPFFLF